MKSIKKDNQVPQNRINDKYILIFLILFIGVILFDKMFIFSGGFMGAMTLYVILREQNKTLIEKRKWKNSTSAILLLFEAIVIFLIPLSIILTLVINTISNIEIDLSKIHQSSNQLIDFIEKKFNFVIFSEENINNVLSIENLSKLPKISGDIIQFVTSNSYIFTINLLVMLFLLYFMLYSYKSFEIAIFELLPFSKNNKTIFLKEAKRIIQANTIGIPLIAIIQGVLSYIGYLIFGVESALLFAILTAFATIIPMVGAALVYFPLTISLLIEGLYPSGFGLLIYSVVLVSSSDNIIRLLLQKKMADIHPLITFFGVFVGLPLLGFWGIIYGPLLLSLFVLMLNMYRNDYLFHYFYDVFR